MACKMHALLFVACAARLAAHGAVPSPDIEVLYPRDRETVYALPHVILYFRLRPHPSAGLARDVEISIDGKRVPAEAITRCAICAGPHPAVSVRKAAWAATEGEHRVAASVEFEGGMTSRSETRYSVDSGWTSLSGLDGIIAYPGAFTPTFNGVQWLSALGEHNDEGRNGVFVSIGNRTLAFQGGLTRFGGGATGAAMLSYHTESRRAAAAVGALNGSVFASAEYRLQPVRAAFVVGFGTDDLPSEWFGARVSLSTLTEAMKAPSTSDFWAVVDLVQFHVEADNRGRFNFGAALSHPYGWSAGIFHLASGGSGWSFAFNIRGALRKR